MISTLKPLKSEEIMEAPRRVWKQSLYVKAGAPIARGALSLSILLLHLDQACVDDFISKPTDRRPCPL